jgi:uncharacterized protein (TIGR00730 family)
MPLGNVCVFCGSRTGWSDEYAAAARALARVLAARDIGLVYGGGAVGLMGIVADAMLAAGGRAIGVIPEALATRELAHPGLTELHVVESMHARKALMAARSEAFIALPGGFGTFEEFCEVVTWTQLGLHRKRCGLLNVGGFYDPLLALFDRAVHEGFVDTANRAIVIAEHEPEALVERLSAPAPATGPAWIRSVDET